LVLIEKEKETMKFAILSQDKVVNIVEAISLEIAEEVTGQICIPYTDENPANIGDTYDTENNVFVSPITNVESEEKALARAALLERLGLTAEEAKLLLS
jgi:hypothetical protein